MQPRARNIPDYLESQVMNAPPQRLRLMLIEACIRHAKRALDAWAEDRNHQASEALIRCQEILGELISGIDPAQRNEVSRQVATLYAYVFRTLVGGTLKRDAKAIGEVIRVLEVEQETWSLLCDKIAADNAPASTSPMLPSLQMDGANANSGGFSIEA